MDILAPPTNDEEKLDSIASIVAAIIYGGVFPNSPEWRLCRTVAEKLSGSGMAMDHLRYHATASAMKRCNDFNQKFPVGTRGVFTDKNVETETYVESKAMVFPSVNFGDKVMAWFRGAGWKDVAQFTAKPLQITPAEHAVSLAQQARANQQHDVARVMLLGALQADENCWQAYNELGVICQENNEWHAARDYFELADAKHPNDTTVLSNIGTACRSLGDDDAAEVAFHKVLALDPGNIHALLNMAALMADHGMLGGAWDNYERVLKRVPNHETALYQRGLILLAAMRFDKGWDAFEFRLNQKSSISHYRHYSVVRFAGRIPDQTDSVLVWTEQGLGDEILMCTMIPDLIATGAKVTLLCSERLVPLMRRSFPQITVGQRPYVSLPEMMQRAPLDVKHLPPEARGEFTMQMSMSDLGKAFRSDVTKFPQEDAGTYLAVDQDECEGLLYGLRARFPGKWLVGLSWESPKNVVIGAFKGLSLGEMTPILTAPNVVFVNLQYGDTWGDIAKVKEQIGVEIYTDDTIDQLRDMDRYAALVAGLDLVVTVSNTTTHVAAAVGTPTMMLTPAGPGAHWYWHHNTRKVPWYSELLLFRQDRSLDWTRAVADVADALKQLSPEGPPQ